MDRAPTLEEWQAAKARYGVGCVVEGRVEIAWDFMIFVALPDSAALGVVTMTSLSDAPPPLQSTDFPGVGAHVKAVVIGYREDGRQLDLSLRASDLARVGVQLRDEFALYLELAGSTSVRERFVAERGPAALAELHARWSGQIVGRGVARATIEARLGPPDLAAPDTIAYRLSTRGGYVYALHVDAKGWCSSGFEREGPAPPLPSAPTDPETWPRFVAALAALGATASELRALVGHPLDISGWWPVEVWTYALGRVELRHGIVE